MFCWGFLGLLLNTACTLSVHSIFADATIREKKPARIHQQMYHSEAIMTPCEVMPVQCPSYDTFGRHGGPTQTLQQGIHMLALNSYTLDIGPIWTPPWSIFILWCLCYFCCCCLNCQRERERQRKTETERETSLSAGASSFSLKQACDHRTSREGFSTNISFLSGLVFCVLFCKKVRSVQVADSQCWTAGNCAQVTRRATIQIWFQKFRWWNTSPDGPHTLRLCVPLTIGNPDLSSVLSPKVFARSQWKSPVLWFESAKVLGSMTPQKQ